MIQLYYDATPNGRKALIMLEECGLPYDLNWIKIVTGDQHHPDYLEISPGGKIPAIVDPQGPGGQAATVFETGAILLYLAEKTGKFIPSDPVERLEVLKWLFWQTSSMGPYVGQAVHFLNYARDRGIDDTYAIERYTAESEGVYDVLDERLEGRDYLAGDYSIADIAVFPWVRVAKGHGVDIMEFANVRRWSETIAKRPATRVKPKIPEKDAYFERTDGSDDAAWNNLFDPKRKAQTRTGKSDG